MKAIGNLMVSVMNRASAAQSVEVVNLEADMLGGEQAWRAALAKSSSALWRKTWYPVFSKSFAWAGLSTSLAGFFTSTCWGGSGTYNADKLQKGMRDNIIAMEGQTSNAAMPMLLTIPDSAFVTPGTS